MQSGQLLQALYNSEINFEISTFWDGGFDWRLGDDMNGFDAEGCGDTFDEAVQQIAAAAMEQYPSSKFARDQAPDAP